MAAVTIESPSLVKNLACKQQSVLCALAIPRSLIYNWGLAASKQHSHFSFVVALNNTIDGRAVQIRANCKRIADRLRKVASEVKSLLKAKKSRRENILNKHYRLLVNKNEVVNVQKLEEEKSTLIKDVEKYK